MKASRVQECGSMDMSKFSHSQAGKIKSKHHFFFLSHFDCVMLSKVYMPHNFIICHLMLQVTSEN